MEAGEYGLTRGTRFVARRLEVVAVVGFLWISYVFWVGRIFSCFFFRFFLFFECTRPAASLRPPCLIYLSISTGVRIYRVPFYLRHSKSWCKTPLGNVAVSTTWQISCGPTNSSTTGVWDVICHIPGIIKSRSDERMWYSPYVHVLSRLTALLTWAASLGWTSAVTCCNIYREYHATCSFYIIIRPSILLVPSSLKLSFRWNVTRSNSRTIWMALFAQFCFVLFNM